MKKLFDLSQLEWTLCGSTPFLWQFEKTMEVGAVPSAEVGPIPAKVPGSVQLALLEAGIIADWNVGMNSRNCEWIEHRHWIFRANLPDDWFESDREYILNCSGLDYSGWVYLNGCQIATFMGSFTPHHFDLTQHIKESGNILEIIFDIPPRWLGQFGYTSQITEWKPRFNYTWDWIPRLVQIGIWDRITIESADGSYIDAFACVAGIDSLKITGKVSGKPDSRVRVSLSGVNEIVASCEIPSEQFTREGVNWTSLAVESWWPNGDGSQTLYTVECILVDADGVEQDRIVRKVGFRSVEWKSCEGSSKDADSWLCVVNGKPVFLAGVNWAPIRPNFADLVESDYRKRLEAYRDIGFNVIRINGCGFAEHDWLYDICDELGIFVWQDFPISSSGIDNWPPEDESAIDEMEQIVRWYIHRLRSHPSILLWCGGNELQGSIDGGKTGIGRPVDNSHPMIARINEVVSEIDPTRRFVPTSGSGPRSCDDPAVYGKGMHWDVHGPYSSYNNIDEAEAFYGKDDALFRSEVCAPGASPIEIIRRYVGDCQEFPCSADNPYWARPTPWWNEWQKFINLVGREPESLQDYVNWSQEHQAWNLAAAYRIRKERFPTNGGIMIWTGHDTFPIPTNASILDYNGDPKPAAIAISKVLKR